jgi:hypothetical protein
MGVTFLNHFDAVTQPRADDENRFTLGHQIRRETTAHVVPAAFDFALSEMCPHATIGIKAVNTLATKFGGCQNVSALTSQIGLQEFEECLLDRYRSALSVLGRERIVGEYVQQTVAQVEPVAPRFGNFVAP